MMSKKETITDEEMQALVDGELSGRRANEILMAAMCFPDIRKRIDGLIRQKERLQGWWEHERPEH